MRSRLGTFFVGARRMVSAAARLGLLWSAAGCGGPGSTLRQVDRGLGGEPEGAALGLLRSTETCLAVGEAGQLCGADTMRWSFARLRVGQRRYPAALA